MCPAGVRVRAQPLHTDPVNPWASLSASEEHRPSSTCTDPPLSHMVPRGRSQGGGESGLERPRRFSLKPDCEPWRPVFGAGAWPGASRTGPGGTTCSAALLGAPQTLPGTQPASVHHRVVVVGPACPSQKHVLAAALACRTHVRMPGRSAGAARTAEVGPRVRGTRPGVSAASSAARGAASGAEKAVTSGLAVRGRRVRSICVVPSPVFVTDGSQPSLLPRQDSGSYSLLGSQSGGPKGCMDLEGSVLPPHPQATPGVLSCLLHWPWGSRGSRHPRAS